MKQQKERDRDRDRDGEAGRQKTLDTDNGEKKPQKKKELLSSESDSIEGGGVDADDITRARLNNKTTVKSELKYSGVK